ncbi:hypothetical protein OIO90_000219 [Microbotryomycetes sp. JL221]|nr:hypothetical protein OIO90_000219 [Microbotryomycetes sp. JL221]
MSTSSSPRNTGMSSTPATSTPAGPSDKMQLDQDSSSDVEVTTPMPKRKTQASGQPRAKKAKLDPSSSNAKTPSTDKTPSSEPKTSAESATNSSLVELKKGKLAHKQRALKLQQIPGALKLRLEFTTWITGVLADADAKIDEYPERHRGLVALAIFESTQTLAGLTTSVKNHLIEIANGAMITEEDSQEAEANAPIKALVQQIATRQNYGLDKSDLPADLLEEGSDVPSSLQLWFWEINDLDLLPVDCRVKAQKRQMERDEMKTAAVALFNGLPDEEKRQLLSGTSSKSKSGKTTDKATASDSGIKASTSSKKKVKTAEQLAEEAEKQKLKEERLKAKEERAKAKAEKEAEKEAERDVKDAEKEAKKAAKEQATKEKEAKAAEREEKRAKKAAETADKEEKAKQKEKTLKKQANLMSGFFIKQSTTPEAEPVVKKSGASDFHKVFLPFHVRSGVKVAPINRFSKARKAKDKQPIVVEINSQDDLTLERKYLCISRVGTVQLTRRRLPFQQSDSLKSFLQDVPKDRIPPRRPEAPLSVRSLVAAVQEAQLTGNDWSGYMKDLQNPKKTRIKLIKFHVDHRPGYIGTWTKTSKLIGPRTPFERDEALLNYDVDSEEEWEADDPDAEDLGSDGDKSDEDGSDALSDDWLCEDDEVEFEEGYTEEGDIAAAALNATGPVDETADARKRIIDRERKSKAIKDGSKKKAAGPLVQVVKGPAYENRIGQCTYQPFSSMRVQLLNDASFGLDPLRFISKPFASVASQSKPVVAAASEASPTITLGKENEQAIKATVTGGKKARKSGSGQADGDKSSRPIPAHLVGDYLRLILASTAPTRLSLVDDIATQMRGGKGADKVTKGMIHDNLAQFSPIRPTSAGLTWSLPDDVKQRHGL